jgi:beta-glucosidase
MVTLHHFTLPWWLAEKKGFETNQGTEAFARFCWFIAKNLGDEIDLWCTINEPDVYTLMGYIRGIWPPFKKNPVMAFTVYSNLVEAHKAAYRAIKQACPDAKIGLAKNNVYYEPYRNNNPFDKFAACIHKYVGNTYFLNRVKKHVDFFGLNYYFFDLIKFDLKKFSINLDYSEEYRRNNPTQPRSDMGWRIYPKGLYHLLADLKAYGKPIYITENGIANARDDMRKDFVRQHLEWISKAIKEGADVRGYFYWSLTDNFEWQDGFDRYFGLVEINYSTQERKVRESAKVFKEILS